jgi:hypothetical protein
MFDAPEFAQGEVQGSGDVRAVSYGSDKGLFVEFRDEPIYNEFQSLATGKPHYDTKVMVKIYTPGDKTKVVDRLARLSDEEARSLGIPPDSVRWPAQWAAYKNGQKAVMHGTPLSEWPMVNRMQAQEFNAFNIYTVEQLSEVSDVALDGLGHGGRFLRDSALTWLAKAGSVDAMENKFKADLAARDEQIAKMAEQLEQLVAIANEPQVMAAIEAGGETPPKRGPGRPPKEQAA